MRSALFLCPTLLLASTTIVQAQEEDFIAHEWGTFTTIQGSDGTQLSGLQIEEEHLPQFVYHHAGVSPDAGVVSKGIYKPMKSVTVKMETPVIYFYSQKERQLSVRVDFPYGSISQWYPQRSAGEGEGKDTIDFAEPYRGWIEWQAKVLAAGSTTPYSAPEKQVIPTWSAPRATDANLVSGSSGEVEKYLFYRGVANFSVPLHVSFDASNRLVVKNTGAEAIPYLFVYKCEKLPKIVASVWWTGGLDAGASRTIDPGSVPLQYKLAEFEDALVAAGLYRKEAEAMLATWQRSYFGQEGFRVFWVVPRSFTDQVLPMKIQPEPRELERVLVGRSEVLTPAFEKTLDSLFSLGKGFYFEKDRYYLAYKERVAQMKVSSVEENIAPETSSPRRDYLSLAPNPTLGTIDISFEVWNDSMMTGAIYNTLGERVASLDEQIETGSCSSLDPCFHRTQADLSGLPTGVYFLRLQSGARGWARKLMKL